MQTETITYIVAPIVSALIGGAAWLVKYILNKRDENQKRIFEERDRDKQHIKDTIEKLEVKVENTSKELKNMQALIIGCEHEDCPNRARLRDYLLKKED